MGFLESVQYSEEELKKMRKEENRSKTLNEILKEDHIASEILYKVKQYAEKINEDCKAEGFMHGIYHFYVGNKKLYLRMGISSGFGYCAVNKSEIEKYPWWRNILLEIMPENRLLINNDINESNNKSMKTTINKPFALNEIGGRSNNEDSIYPIKGEATENDKLFLVCDGVGGSEKGEIASQLVCESFGFYFEEKPLNNDTEYNEDFVRGALEYAQNKIDGYLLEHPEAKGMGTTLTMLHLNTQGVTIAHVGDSRVYQIRNGEIIFKTSDHSFVNELVKEGIITEEKAKTHPKRNVITRAIQGNSVKPTQADVFVQADIQKGDYFFLCTDGILEQITDEILLEIISADTTDKEKTQEIDLRCKGKTKDNYSCYLVPVKEVVVNSKNTIQDEEVLFGTIIEEPETKENNIIDDFKEKSEEILKKGYKSLKNLFKK